VRRSAAGWEEGLSLVPAEVRYGHSFGIFISTNSVDISGVRREKMSTQTQTTLDDEESKIRNWREVKEDLEEETAMLPDGDDCDCEVESPRLDQQPPKCLRVSVYRKGWNFNVIQKAKEHGLEVTDVWQYDGDQEEERAMFKLEVRD